MKCSVCIQAGGQSRRMGENKALMLFAGQLLIQRVIERVRPLAAELIVISNEPDLFAFLGVPVIPDQIPGRGALSGLYTALHAARHPLVATVACDMPFVNPDLLLAELDLLISSNSDVIIPESTEGLEPLHAVYRREVCLPFVHEALFQNNHRLIGWFERVKVQVMTVAEVNGYDPDHSAFINVNTPDDFQQAVKKSG